MSISLACKTAILDLILLSLDSGPFRSGLQGAQAGLQQALPGLKAVTAGVNAGTGTNVDDLNAIAEGLVVAQQAFDRVKG